MTAGERSSLSLHRGGYLGEISALCFVHVPPHISSFPFLLVGTGSQMLLYDVELGTLLNSFHVFDGIRVHGISCSSLNVTYDGLCSQITSTVVVFGEKRIKLFSLRLEMQTSQSRSMVSADLVLNLTLPRFSQWVMDVLFLKEDHMSAEYEGNNYLAVGLGENSVCLWDISRSSMVFDVRCPEKTLLYSMRLWGSNINSFLVASGTIYNEVIVWKVVSVRHSSSPANSLGNSNSCDKLLGNKSWLHNKDYEAVYLNRLTGHEGSIFRLAWSPDGSKLMSVSDDRSARIWNIDVMMKDSANASIDGPDSDVLILFGHSARVWDCSISDSLIVTAGEDCTCRVWGMDGKQLLLIKEHTGRGIWRCTYDPISSLLITAGFDSSVKVHMLQASLSRGTAEQNRVVVEGLKEKMEVFTLSVPNLSDQLKLLNSKSEYVRCLHFTQEDILYVATNNGYLYHVKFSSATDVKWTEIVRVSEDVPIVCMDLLSRERSNLSRVEEDWIAVGDGKGNMTIVRVAAGGVSPVVLLTFTWSAGMERQLLGTYWCNSLGPGYIFTADPRGTLKLWKIHDLLQSGLAQTSGNIEALLTAEFISCFGTRVVCLDASFDEQVLVCGDLRGNLIMFSLSKGLSTLITSEMKDSPISFFKGAHGISSVTSISVSTTSFNQVEVRSTGADGCICYFKYDREWRGLEFTGMKQVKELSLIQFVSPDAGSDEDLARGNYAVGFASSDFIIWNLLSEMKVVQVSCGGWRRPHSYYLGDVPESQSCFAFVKDHAIHIHKLWVLGTEKKLSPVLHMQYHGREIHTLCLISDALQSGSDEDGHLNRFSCIATGCEDGTVRLTRYAPDYQNWTASKLLGEHVGGSAVRSICFVSRIYRTAVDGSYMSNDQDGCNLASNEVDNPFLLISVGAKRVLTSWRLQQRRSSREFEESKNSVDHCQRALPSMSFQWLSTDMPSKFSSTHIKIDSTKDNIVQKNDATNGRTGPSNYELDSKGLLGDVNENDWRYLDVTAFLVKGTDCRSTVCFVVVSCSDATLTLRALILPYRLWFDVAVLVPQTAPVLSLQYVVLPTGPTSQDNLQVGCAYILINGSTDGSLTFWDLTESVEGFMQRFSKTQPENFADCQIRPRTGRGSQGGRWWKKLNSPQTKDISGSEEGRDDSPIGISEIGPFHVLKNVHQSGVNCLHVTNISGYENTESISASYCVLSGGDDQALNCLTFKLFQKPCDGDGYKHVDHVTDLRHGIKLPLQSENHRCKIQFLSHDRVASAHSSAVKGVWTDGLWAFTTGLDQRVRCWELKEQSILHEHGQLVISVTEPETLDAKACARNQYQIAVAGRGVEMVEFCASQDIAIADRTVNVI